MAQLGPGWRCVPLFDLCSRGQSNKRTAAKSAAAEAELETLGSEGEALGRALDAAQHADGGSNGGGRAEGPVAETLDVLGSNRRRKTAARRREERVDEEQGAAAVRSEGRKRKNRQQEGERKRSRADEGRGRKKERRRGGGEAEPDFKYEPSPVRKAKARQELPAHDCHECREFFEAAAAAIPGLDKDKLLEQYGRHRSAHEKAPTPQHFWSIDHVETINTAE